MSPRRDDFIKPNQNPHRHIQQVIDHQSRARQKSRPVPQVLLSNRVRSPAHRISRNRLPITEIHNHQQPNDRGRQRHNVPDAHQPQRQQNRQSRLRPVSRRTQSIQTKRRNPLSRSNPLPLILGRSQWPPKQNINESHIPSHPATITKPETSAKPTMLLSDSSNQHSPTLEIPNSQPHVILSAAKPRAKRMA